MLPGLVCGHPGRLVRFFTSCSRAPMAWVTVASCPASSSSWPSISSSWSLSCRASYRSSSSRPAWTGSACRQTRHAPPGTGRGSERLHAAGAEGELEVGKALSCVAHPVVAVKVTPDAAALAGALCLLAGQVNGRLAGRPPGCCSASPSRSRRTAVSRSATGSTSSRRAACAACASSSSATAASSSSLGDGTVRCPAVPEERRGRSDARVSVSSSSPLSLLNSGSASRGSRHW